MFVAIAGVTLVTLAGVVGIDARTFVMCIAQAVLCTYQRRAAVGTAQVLLARWKCSEGSARQPRIDAIAVVCVARLDENDPHSYRKAYTGQRLPRRQ